MVNPITTKGYPWKIVKLLFTPPLWKQYVFLKGVSFHWLCLGSPPDLANELHEHLRWGPDLDPRCLLGRGPSCAPPLYRPSIPKINVSVLPKSRGVRRENSFYSLNFPMSYISICRCTNYRDLICWFLWKVHWVFLAALREGIDYRHRFQRKGCLHNNPHVKNPKRTNKRKVIWDHYQMFKTITLH